MKRALILLVTLCAVTAHAVDFKGDLRAWSGTGLDTNPRRDFTSAGVFPTYDLFVPVVASGSATLLWEKAQLSGSYDVAGRKFFLFPSEDTVIQSALLDGSFALGRYFGVGANFRVRDRRGAERDYTDLGAEAYVEFIPDAKLDVKVRGGWHRFLYWNRFAASHWGSAFGASAAYRFNKRHSVFLHGDLEPQSFNAKACLRFEGPNIGQFSCQSDPPPPVRQDTVLSVALGYTYRGPFQLMVQYAYLDSTSNSWGETFRRHRLSATLGVRLPLGFTLLSSGAVQFAQYPDGVFLSSDLVVLEDDENANMLTVKLVHPLGPHVDIDFKYAVYFNRLVRNDLTYLRMVGSLGFSWKL